MNNAIGKLDVVIAGPVPPPSGGVAGFVALLSAAAASHCGTLRVLDTSTHLDVSATGIWSVRNILYATRLSASIARCLRRNPPDVVQVEAGGYLGLLKAAGLLLAAGPGARILSLHSPHVTADIVQAKPPGRHVIAAAVRRSAAIRCMFDQQADDLRALVPDVPADRFHVIRPFIPPGSITRTPRQAGGVRVLSVGTVGRRKGSFELVESVAAVRRDGLDVRCIFLGDEERDGQLAELENAIQTRDLTDAVELRGQVSREVVAEELGKADVFALPSHAEGLPLAVMEAMRAGLPLLVTAVGAIPDAVHQPEVPPLPPGDVGALTGALRRLAADPELRARCSQANLERVGDHLSPDAVVPEFLRLWESAAGFRR